jgi:hypothetical protein
MAEGLTALRRATKVTLTRNVLVFWPARQRQDISSLARGNMAARQKRWIYSPPRPPKPKVPEAVKAAVEAKARELIEIGLKPKHIKPPPEDMRFNYVVEIYAKWYRNYFYFCSKYRCPGPNAISPFFDARFARLEYLGHDRYNLSYMRHTEQWWEVYQELSLEQCLAAIRDEPHFLP